jgi:rhodanese-related sulfurtransferase
MQSATLFPPTSRLWGSVALGVMLCGSALAGTPPGTGQSAAWQCPLLVEALRDRRPPPAAPKVTGGTESCLVDATALDSHDDDVFDLRDPDSFLAFHVPGAQRISVAALTTLPGMSSRSAVVYDSGRFRSDALMLCDRLRRYGLKQIHVVDGGIAAWAQAHAKPEVMTLNRLADTDVAAALAEPGSRPIALADTLNQVLPITVTTSDQAKAKRLILLATPATLPAAIRTRLRPGQTAFYWVGTPTQLRRLLDRQLALEQKRLSGPAVSKTCSAL